MAEYTSAPNGGLGREVTGLLKSNIRNYTMYVALIVIFFFFNVQTGGLFLSARNISDLINQTGYVAVLAIGMTIILIIKHIDLSVGYVAGFLGAVAATLLASGLNVFIVIPIILGLGLLVGLYQGSLVSLVGVPAFVTTLAGMFMFRGLLTLVTAKSGTIIVTDETFKALSGYLPDFTENGLHTVTLVIGAVAIVAMVAIRLNGRKKQKKYGFDTISLPLFVVSVLLIAAVIGIIFWMLASYRGLPVTAVVVAIVLFVYNFILNKTRLGRYIYGIGGNSEAAQLSGINVKKITLIAFMSMSMLAALSGILYTSRMASATPTAGNGWELEAIASSYIGGVAVSGGVGRVTNTIIGALIMSSLTNGMNLMGIDISYQYVVKGIIFILAVAFDVITRNKAK